MLNVRKAIENQGRRQLEVCWEYIRADVGEGVFRGHELVHAAIIRWKSN